MYTHCPHCDTCFRVTTEQLKAARGSVRCGRCFGTFNAVENLVDEPPQPETAPPALTPAAPAPTPIFTAVKPGAAPRPPVNAPTPEEAPRRSSSIARLSSAPKPAQEPEKPETEVEEQSVKSVASTQPAPAVAPPPNDLARDAQLERSQLLVEEIQATSVKPSRNLLWLWLALATLLTLLLIGQYAWFNVASLAQQPQLRPALSALCGVTGCEVPLIKAPQMITLVERDIRNHPERPNVLLVKALIINKAPFTQAYPLMELSLHDITGHILASRRFTPGEYLARNVEQKRGMEPQQVVDIQLELSDPGKEAVGFEFNFF